EKVQSDNPWGVQIRPTANVVAAGVAYLRGKLCFVGQELNEELTRELHDANAPFRVKVQGPNKPDEFVTRGGTVDAQGAAAALAGNILYMETPNAPKILGRDPGLVNRLDLMLEPGHDPEKVRQRVQAVIEQEKSRATVQTPEENARTSQNAMSGMQVGFALC